MMKFDLSVGNLRRALVALTIGAIAVVCTQAASATTVTLGSASTYGLFVGSGNTLSLGGKFDLTGNLGLGNNDTLSLAGSTNAVTGNEIHDSTLTTNGSGSLSVSGSTTTQSIATVRVAAENASTTAAADTATVGLTDQGGSINLSNSSVTIKALTNLSENVLDISALSLSNSTLTFDDNGFTGAKFIVNITGNFSVSSNGSHTSAITGINGATGADIIFNVENSGSTVSITGNSSTSVIGTILAPQANVTLGGGGSLTGALFAGIGGQGYTVTTQSSGFNITDFAYKPQAAQTPEPSSIALLGAGLSALIAARRRSRSKRP